MKSADEIRKFVLNRLGNRVSRPSMWGGELGILGEMDLLTYIDERQEEWSTRRKELHQRQAFNAGGVTGACQQILRNHRRGSCEKEVASIYAVIAFEMGYLSAEGEDRPQRLLEDNELESVLQTAVDLARGEPCTPDDAIERFGAPSMRWGTNDYYPCTLSYFGTFGSGRYVHFDFWAEWYKNPTGLQVPGKFGPKPLLRNLRIPAAMFPDEFVWTTLGQELLSQQGKSSSKF